jgi:hypothetical protein
VCCGDGECGAEQLKCTGALIKGISEACRPKRSVTTVTTGKDSSSSKWAATVLLGSRQTQAYRIIT